MGQELLDRVGYTKVRPKYYLATNSKGHSIVRGSTTKKYTHAVISVEPFSIGYCYGTFTTRLDLANRYCNRFNKNETYKWEVVEVKEVSTKEARQLKKDIHARAVDYQELYANKTAQVYLIERDTDDNQA